MESWVNFSGKECHAIIQSLTISACYMPGEAEESLHLKMSLLKHLVSPDSRRRGILRIFTSYRAWPPADFLAVLNSETPAWHDDRPSDLSYAERKSPSHSRFRARTEENTSSWVTAGSIRSGAAAEPSKKIAVFILRLLWICSKANYNDQFTPSEPKAHTGASGSLFNAVLILPTSRKDGKLNEPALAGKKVIQVLIQPSTRRGLNLGPWGWEKEIFPLRQPTLPQPHQ